MNFIFKKIWISEGDGIFFDIRIKNVNQVPNVCPRLDIVKQEICLSIASWILT